VRKTLMRTREFTEIPEPVLEAAKSPNPIAGSL
jgi:hypothetical protein